MRIKAWYDSRGQRLIDKLFKEVEKVNSGLLNDEETVKANKKIEKLSKKIKDRKNGKDNN